MPNEKLTQQASQAKSATDWDGLNDPYNPHNWPLSKRLFHTSIPASIGFLCPFGSSVYTPGHTQILSEFHTTRIVALLPFTFYLLGLSLGPIFAAPMSETYGRKIVYLTALPVSALFTLGAGFSNDIASLTSTRLFAGLFSSVGLSIGTGTISDIWPPEQRGAPMGAFITFVQMGPAMGPLIGGFVTEKENWRWTQWVMLIGGAAVIGMTIFMSETYKKTILQRRAKKLKLEQQQQQHSASETLEKKSITQTIRFFATKTIIRPLDMLFTEPIVTLWDLYIAFNFGLLNSFFAGFSYVFKTVYGFDLGRTGLTYLGQAVGSIVGFMIQLYVFYRVWLPQGRRAKEVDGSSLAPEHRLVIAKMGAPLIPVSLFWFAWTARPSIHWISPVIAEGFFACGNLLLFLCSSLYLTDCYGSMYGASAWSSNTFLRYLFAFAFPLFTIQMYKALGVGWATSLLAFVSTALVPIPFVLERYGPALRRRSKYTSNE